MFAGFAGLCTGLALLGTAAVADTGGVSGHVWVNGDHGTGEPAYGSTVTANGLFGDFSTEATKSGFFVFLDLPPGKYTMYGYGPGRTSGCAQVIIVEPDETRHVDLNIMNGSVLITCLQPGLSTLNSDATADVYDIY
jgi:hypothetical protein